MSADQLPSVVAVQEAALDVIRGAVGKDAEVLWGSSKNPPRACAGLAELRVDGDWGNAMGASREQKWSYVFGGFVYTEAAGGKQEEATRKADALFERIAAAFLEEPALTLGDLCPQAVRVQLTDVIPWPTDKGHKCEYQFDLIIPVRRTRRTQ